MAVVNDKTLVRYEFLELLLRHSFRFFLVQKENKCGTHDKFDMEYY